jgi:hypothetical protein
MIDDWRNIGVPYLISSGPCRCKDMDAAGQGVVELDIPASNEQGE